MTARRAFHARLFGILALMACLLFANAVMVIVLSAAPKGSERLDHPKTTAPRAARP